MFLNKIPKLKIGDTIVKVPIIQGGMGVGISLSGLASAVANEGGIGVIAANGIGLIDDNYFTNGKEANIRVLRSEIRKAKLKTMGPIGINIMIAADNFQDMIEVSIEEKADMVILGAGLPIRNIPVEKLRTANVKIIPIVSSARAAGLIFRTWEKKYSDVPDAVIVEGPMAGGHLGFKLEQIDDQGFALEKILPEVVQEVKQFEKLFLKEIPVIAAGGVFTGDDIYKFFQLGAKGVQMGTRFVATDECDANIRFKEAYVNCKKEDIGIIKSPVGLPGRAIRNSFLDDVSNGIKKFFKCPWKCITTCDGQKTLYCISLALNNARKGLLEQGYAFCGANAFRVEKIVPVKELMFSLVKEYETAEAGFIVNLKNEYNKLVQSLASIRKEYSTSAAILVMNLQEGYDKAMMAVSRLKDEYTTTLIKKCALKKKLIALKIAV